jgi:DNA polymerase III alpha subunit
MCIATLEDRDGAVGVTVFPHLFRQTEAMWVEQTFVLVRGRVEFRHGEPTILCEEVHSSEAEDGGGEAP